jgi:hypothetical protein
VSTDAARYVRELLVPSDGSPPAPDVAALSRSARHLAEVLANMAGVGGDCWPSVETLATRMGVTAANVRRARVELVNAGVIAADLSVGGPGRTNRYRFPVGDRLSTTRAPARESDPANPRGGARQPARWRAATRAVARGEVSKEGSIEDAPLTADDDIGPVPDWFADRFATHMGTGAS